jgi:hypothetical protein
MSITKQEMADLLNDQARLIAGGNIRDRTNNNIPSGGGTIIDMIKSATGVSAVQDQIRNTTQSFSRLSEAGFNFSGDVMGMSLAATKARLSLSDFEDVVVRGARTGINGLGSTASMAAKNFANMSDSFSQNGEGFADKLRLMGFTNAEYNKVLLMTMQTQRASYGVDEEGRLNQVKLHEATYALSMELEKAAQISGTSRKASMEGLEELRKDARQQAFSRGLQREASDNFSQMVVSMNSMGLGGVLKDVVTQAAPSEQTRAIIAALGPVGTELYQSMAQYREALKTNNTTDIALARQRVTAAEIQIGEQLKNGALQNVIMTNNGKFADNIGAFYIKYLNTADGLQRTMDGYKVDATRAREIQRDIAEGAAKGIVYQENVLKNGKLVIDEVATQAAKTADITRKADARKADLEVEASKVVYTGLVRMSQILNGLEAGLDVKNLRSLFLANTEVIKSIKEGNAAEVIKSQTKVLFDYIQANWKTTLETVVDQFKTNLGAVWEGIKKGATGQATGSKDVFGDWFNKDWGSGGLSMLHGREAVIPQDKLGEFMSDMIPNLSSITSQMKEMPLPDLSSIPQTISSSMSNMYSGGSQQTNLDDIFKQLETLNKTMSQHLPQMVDSIDKQVRATKQLSPNVGIRA